MNISSAKEGTGQLQKKVGAVMVVGGGISGMQSALDLANSGFKVYLVEETTSIGGRMAQLDKTFPTNDCSMCMISPKLIEVQKHRNITIISNAKVKALEGEAGNFKAKVWQRPRFIDLEKCTTCGDCVDICPVKLPSEFEQGLTTRKAIHKRYPQAIPSAMAISKRGTAPCTIACPTHISVQGYIALIAQGKYREALALIREENPLPGVCGRVCVHPCETMCSLGKIDEPVSICQLKRFASDKVIESGNYSVPKPAELKDSKVAIVGSGPAGLTAAYYLALQGYQPTIFEALPQLGGMMRVGIPAYHLPRNILDTEIKAILGVGVEVETNHRVESLDELFDSGYRAVFLATGAHKGIKAGIDGEDNHAVMDGMEYLRKVNLDQKFKIGKNVAVIGGSIWGNNVAIDCARTALRKGVDKVTIIYRRTRAEMPAAEKEIEAALHEGINIVFLTAPVGIHPRKDGRLDVQFQKMELGEPDASGGSQPVPVAGSEFISVFDNVIFSAGQATDIPEGFNVSVGKGNVIQVNNKTLATSRKGVFAGGDVVTGPKYVIEAIAAGKEAAISIDRYLKGQDMEAGRDQTFTEVEVPLGGIEKQPRHEVSTIPLFERKDSFKEVALNFTEEHARAEAERCLSCGLCSECYQCVAVCQAKAIDHRMAGDELEIEIGSVVLAPGFEPFNATLKGELGYGRMPNVVTSMEFERILSASGPFQGQILRPSDHKHAVRIAWIQCVGSRDETCGKDYCSSVCCMYATKEAIIAKEHASDIQPTIFYNDMRTFGKGFERYFESAKEKFGVRYARGIPSTVKELQQTHNLLLEYEDGHGQKVQDEFDMVVLSVGLVPSASTRELADRLSIDLDKFGFCKTEELEPNVTSRPGIYVAGVFDAPMDIPESVMNASSAAALASEDIAVARGTMVTEKEYPPEDDISGQEPRVGVFVCRCGSNIARVVDVPNVTEYATCLPYVVHAEENLYTCSTDTQKGIMDVIKEKGINRVVVASCSPRTHESLFQDTIREAGLNKFLFEMANIRDQCSWVHASHLAEATEKAKDLVRMAVARAVTLEPLYQSPVPVVRRGLVIGGGLSGITAALGLASQGFETILVERDQELGGNLRHIHYTLEGSDPQVLLASLLQQINKEPKIKVYTSATIKDLHGRVGDYKTVIATSTGDTEEIQHGVVILATGATEYKPVEYKYGQSKDVLTQSEFEEMLAAGKIDVKKLKSVVMIQCVGSREEDHMYCSRLCCSQAIKNAIKIKDANPDTEIYVLYRDIRTYAMKELKYREARDKGVTFIRYEVDKKPNVEEEDGKLRIRVLDSVLNRDVLLSPDLLVLSSAIRPQPDAAEFASKLKLPLTQDGFYMEAHMKLRPLDFANEGMFLCGLAHAPKFISECISQARGAMSRAITILSQPHLMVGGVISVVNQENCMACLTCVRSCPFGVPGINTEGKAYIEPAACQGCGICASLCPRKTIEMKHYSERQMAAKINALCSAY